MKKVVFAAIDASFDVNFPEDGWLFEVQGLFNSLVGANSFTSGKIHKENMTNALKFLVGDSQFICHANRDSRSYFVSTTGESSTQDFTYLYFPERTVEDTPHFFKNSYQIVAPNLFYNKLVQRLLLHTTAPTLNPPFLILDKLHANQDNMQLRKLFHQYLGKDFVIKCPYGTRGESNFFIRAATNFSEFIAQIYQGLWWSCSEYVSLELCVNLTWGKPRVEVHRFLVAAFYQENAQLQDLRLIHSDTYFNAPAQWDSHQYDGSAEINYLTKLYFDYAQPNAYYSSLESPLIPLLPKIRTKIQPFFEQLLLEMRRQFSATNALLLSQEKQLGVAAMKFSSMCFSNEYENHLKLFDNQLVDVVEGSVAGTTRVDNLRFFAHPKMHNPNNIVQQFQKLIEKLLISVTKFEGIRNDFKECDDKLCHAVKHTMRLNLKKLIFIVNRRKKLYDLTIYINEPEYHKLKKIIVRDLQKYIAGTKELVLVFPLTNKDLIQFSQLA